MKNGGVKIKKQKLFPYYELYKETFPIDKETIFVYKDTIYTDIPREKIPFDIYYHELEHLRSQQEIGADIWVERYINSQKFRLQEELRAYRYQLKMVLETTGDKQEHFNILTESARNLSSPLYGNLVKYQQAIDLLKLE